MHRWIFLLVLGGLTAASPSTACAAPPPNILVLFADDLGIGDLGVNGQLARAAAGLPAISTPNIDALAAESLQFRNMYASAPFCSPSRASILTGFDHSHVTKEWVDGYNGLRAGEQDRTWGSIMQDAGYATAMFGKWHLGGVSATTDPQGVVNFDAIPTQQGFQHVFGGMLDGYRPPNFWESDGEGGLRLTPNSPDPSWTGPGAPVRFSEEVVTERVVDFIREKSDEPFGAYVAFKAPHDPFQYVKIHPLYEDKDWSDPHKQYASLITRMDQQVGQILGALDDPNGDGDPSDSIADDTMVVFASDNGPLWTKRPGLDFSTEFFDSNSIYNGQKSNTLEGGIRSPFLVRWTGAVQPGVNTAHVGSFSDVLPTFAELVGQDAPVGIDGSSMLPTFFGGQAEQQDVMVWQAVSNFRGLDQAGWAIRLGDWKLIWRTFSETHQLYDLRTDPTESTDQFESKPTVAAALMALAEQEGLDEEPYMSTGDDSRLNVFFTQYKHWSPQNGSDDFGAAGNWSGGTQYLRDEHEANGVEALYWNTGPAKNWIASALNEGPSPMRLRVASDATVLGLSLAGPAAPLHLDVSKGAELNARNGIRIDQGAAIDLQDATLRTIRDVDIRDGGTLAGAGLVTGEQQLIAGIAEFQGRDLLRPRVLNSGVIDVGGADEAGVLHIEGDLIQSAAGVLQIDVYGDGGVAVGDADHLLISGRAQLSGRLQLRQADGFTPQNGESFDVVVTSAGREGEFELVDAPALPAGLNWLLAYSPNAVSMAIVDQLHSDFDQNRVVDGADYLILQRNFGLESATQLQGDASGDGVVDGVDAAIWQAQLGDRFLAPSSAPATIPEPTTGMLLLCVAAASGVQRRLVAPWRLLLKKRPAD